MRVGRSARWKPRELPRSVSPTDEQCRVTAVLHFQGEAQRLRRTLRLKIRTRDELRTSRQHVCYGWSGLCREAATMGGRARSGFAGFQGTKREAEMRMISRVSRLQSG